MKRDEMSPEEMRRRILAGESGQRNAEDLARGMAMRAAREPNQFEAGSRRIKVAKMVAIADRVIRLMGEGVSDAEAARRFTRFRQEDRARVALLAGVNVPSDASWKAFCEAVRTRGELAVMDEEPIDEVIS